MRITKLLNYIEKIGEKGIAPSRLSSNSNYASHIINMLSKYDLITIYGERFKTIYLSEKGLKIYNLVKQIEQVLEGREEVIIERIERIKGAPKILENAPSFLVENPWIAVLSKRGRENV